MKSLPGFRAAYHRALAVQAEDRNHEITAFDRNVAEAVWNATRAAIQDHRQGISSYRVVSAPTGSGKSSYAMAAIAGLVEDDPDASAVFLCETIDQCEDTYQELIKLIDPEDVAVWTTAHDLGNDLERVQEDHGFTPSARVWVEDLDKYRVVVATHNFYKGSRGHLCRTFMGRPRTLTVIDERPSEVTIVDLTTGEVKVARDIVAERDGVDADSVQALDSLHEYLERLWKADGSRAQLEPLARDFHGQWFLSEEAGVMMSEHPREAVRQTISLARSIMSGYAFMSRYSGGSKGGRFVGYRLDMPVVPGTILLDATSDIDGVSQVVSWRHHVHVPSVRFDRLTIKHVTPPVDVVPLRSAVSQLVKTRKKAEPYAEWIKDCVVENTKEGERVLVVAHKALMDHAYLPEDATTWETAADLQGRQVCFINWGYGIGSNRWKEADAVFLMGEFYIPRRATVAQTLGLQEKQATEDALKPMQSNNAQHAPYLTLRDGHLMRWEKQLAMRGNARNIDGNGICGEQRLYVTGEFRRWAKYKDLLFPGATFVQSNGSKAQTKKRGGAPALISLLTSWEGDFITSIDIRREVGIDMQKHKKHYLENEEVKAAMQRHAWRFVPGGGRGNPSRFQRIDGRDYGFRTEA